MTRRTRLLPMLLGLLLHAPAFGDTGRLQFNLPPQPLVQALETLSAQTKLQMFYSTETVQGKTTSGLAGSYTFQEAISKLLEDTGLKHEFTADNAVAIKNPQRLAANDAGDSKKPKKNHDEPTVLEEMTVTASPTDDTSYNVLDATTATKTDTPIMETPVSIQVIPQQVLKDQQVVRIEKALQNVSGVGSVQAPGFQDTFVIRGFRTDNYFVDGARISPGFSASASRETANLEQIEVLKGPASILYGRIEPGGLVNVVRKQPLASSYYALEQQFGSFDFYRTTADATGPLTKDDALLYRLNLAYENAGSFREFLSGDRAFLAPALRWNISPHTQANFYLDTCTANNRKT